MLCLSASLDSSSTFINVLSALLPYCSSSIICLFLRALNLFHTNIIPYFASSSSYIVTECYLHCLIPALISESDSHYPCYVYYIVLILCFFF